MTETPCATDCGRPAHDARICPQCAWELERDLGDIAAIDDGLAAHLDLALSRQARMGDGSMRRSAETPMPYDVGASEAIAVLRSALVGWVRELDPQTWPADTLPSMAAWLLSHRHDIAQHQAAEEAYDEIRSAVANARRVIDRPIGRWYAGPCEAGGCEADLYALNGATSVLCSVCGTVHTVEDRREWLREHAENHLATAKEISGLCKMMLGDMVTEAMIRGYAYRGTLTPHGRILVDGRWVATYRVGDVLTVAARAGVDAVSRRDARRAAREAVA